MSDTEKIRVLIAALKAALKWQYDMMTLDHIRGKAMAKNYDPAYVADVHDMQAGVRVAADLGESVIKP